MTELHILIPSFSLSTYFETASRLYTQGTSVTTQSCDKSLQPVIQAQVDEQSGDDRASSFSILLFISTYFETASRVCAQGISDTTQSCNKSLQSVPRLV